MQRTHVPVGPKGSRNELTWRVTSIFPRSPVRHRLVALAAVLCPRLMCRNMRAALLLTGAEGCCVAAPSCAPLTCTAAPPNLMRGPCPACSAGAATTSSSKLMRCCPPVGTLPAPAVAAACGLAGSGREGAHGRLLSSWSLEVSVLASLSEEGAAGGQPAAGEEGSQTDGLTASIAAGVSMLPVVHQR